MELTVRECNCTKVLEGRDLAAGLGGRVVGPGALIREQGSHCKKTWSLPAPYTHIKLLASIAGTPYTTPCTPQCQTIITNLLSVRFLPSRTCVVSTALEFRSAST